MAEQEMEVTFKWENDVFFSMSTRKNQDERITDIRIEENAHIDTIWSAIQSACIGRVSQILSDIGKEMKE